MRGLRRRADRVLAQRGREIALALNAHSLRPSHATGIALVTLGIEQLEQLGHTRASIEKLIGEVLDTPVEKDIRAHTGGT